ncbi:hypothetical protein ACS0TY_028736 [Phlomoides rotata]
MTLNEEENVCGLMNLGGGGLEEFVDAEIRKYMWDFDDSESDNCRQDIADVLPDDPFEMDSNPTLPRDPFGMDIIIEATVEVFTGWDLGVKAHGFEADKVADNSNDDNRLKVAEDDSGGDNRFLGKVNFVWSGWESESVDVDSMISTESSLYIVEDSMYFGCEKYEIEHVKDENNGDGGLKGYGIETDEVADDNRLKAAEDDSDGDNSVFAELNLFWTGSVECGQEDADSMINSDNSPCVVEDLMCSGCDKDEIEHVKDENNGDGGAAAADMIIFVLRYLNLGVKDLLTIEMVCKSLRDGVRKDPYLWTKIHIDHCKLSNDDLLRLTDRAQGKLCSLGLEKCINITNDGLQRVLERNLELTKLSVAGSNKFSLEGVMDSLKVFNSIAKPGIKHIRIADIKNLIIAPIGITNELKLLLGADEDAKPNNYKPRFYCAEIYLSLDDERAIDVERCPRCQVLRQVYDCPTENCRVTSHSTQTCKACIQCIARCIQCGCCLDDKAYEELFNFEARCYDCLKEYLKSVKNSPGQSYFHPKYPMASYHFYVYS